VRRGGGQFKFAAVKRRTEKKEKGKRREGRDLIRK